MARPTLLPNLTVPFETHWWNHQDVENNVSGLPLAFPPLFTEHVVQYLPFLR